MAVARLAERAEMIFRRKGIVVAFVLVWCLITTISAARDGVENAPAIAKDNHVSNDHRETSKRDESGAGDLMHFGASATTT
jgi:hypothetical protein